MDTTTVGWLREFADGEHGAMYFYPSNPTLDRNQRCGIGVSDDPLEAAKRSGSSFIIECQCRHIRVTEEIESVTQVVRKPML